MALIFSGLVVNLMALASYCYWELATSSGIPMALSKLEAVRLAKLSPIHVSTCSPTHNASHAFVPAL